MRVPLNMREISHHAEHGLLLGTYDMCLEHKLRGTTELRACSGRCHLRNRLASPDHRPCIGLEVRAGFDGDGFAGKHGLINLNRSLSQAHVGRNHGSERQLHDVARHQLGGGQIRPDAIPPNRRSERQPRLQGGKGCLGTPLLEESERGVEHQQTRDDRGPGILAVYRLKHDRGFEHPGNRRPEFFQCPAKWILSRVRHRVGTELLQPAAGFVARETCRGIHGPRRRCHIGTLPA